MFATRLQECQATDYLLIAHAETAVEVCAWRIARCPWRIEEIETPHGHPEPPSDKILCDFFCPVTLRPR
ncbi:MAG: hypothetical protein KGI97_00640 [Alphaproteobacteria bacterium]|nr:hypothetical protein [Alphaproteobacteria bacterium]